MFRILFPSYLSGCPAAGGGTRQINPIATSSEQPTRIDLARVDYWLGVGAKASDRVAALLGPAFDAVGADAFAGFQATMRAIVGETRTDGENDAG